MNITTNHYHIRDNKMQFNTQEERIAAIKKACEDLGKVYGEMKFQEHMLVEFKQSFVPNAPVVFMSNAPVAVVETPAPAPVVEEPKAKPAAKAKPKAEPVAAAPAPVVEEPKPKDEPKVIEEPMPKPAANPVVACPVTTASGLREVMLSRFNESGRSAEVQAALKAAVLESAGVEKVLDVKPELIPACYAAIMAVAI
jgi:outer membrane biosynthesis protein TonB